MPTTLPTVIGTEMPDDGYRQIFNAIRLDVTFTIDELVVTSAETAHALTRSNGRSPSHTGDQSAESNREIFLFRRANTGSWKISRDMFNKPE